MAANDISLPASLEGFPVEVCEAFRTYRRSDNADDLVRFVLLAVAFLNGREPLDELLGCAPESRLREDLGVDSLAVAELVFLLEDLLAVTISDVELREVTTLDDLRGLIVSKATLRMPG